MFRFDDPRPLPRLAVPLAVLGLLLVFILAGAISLRGDSVTSDETAHIAAGYTYLDRFDFRLNPEHPPAAKLLAALPLRAGAAGRPDYDTPSWRGRSLVGESTLRTGADQWTFGFEFLNGSKGRPRRDPAERLVPARLAAMTWGVLLGLIVFGWSRELWGSRAALFSLALFCLSPTMLAHARLVTTDMPLAVGFTLTLWCAWRFYRAPEWGRALAVGGALGLALLTKFSALILPPLVLALGAAWVYDPGAERWERPGRFSRLLLFGLVILLIAYAAVWAGYGFRYLASPDPTYLLDWEQVEWERGVFGRVARELTERKALPQAYIYGLAHTVRGAGARLAYLNGEQSVLGWWYYFPETFLLKTTPALLLASLLTCVLAVIRARSLRFSALFLGFPVLMYMALSMTSNLNIGHRHIAPIYPLLFVACGALPGLLSAGKVRTALLAALLAAQGVSFLAAAPGYLSYFNVFAGGAEGGRRYLLDSNLDWGQDLRRLAETVERNGYRPLHLAYFGTADPKAYGLQYEKLRLVPDFYPEDPAVLPRSGGYLAASANLLAGLYLDEETEIARRAAANGWVGRDRIEEWVKLRDGLVGRGERHPALLDWLESEGEIDAGQRRTIERNLLSTYLRELDRTQRPIDRAGDSILIYRLP